MKTCCEHNAPAHGCNSGRLCPVRAARNSGVCSTEPDTTDLDTTDSDTTLYLICMVIVYGICGGAIAGALISIFS